MEKVNYKIAIQCSQIKSFMYIGDHKIILLVCLLQFIIIALFMKSKYYFIVDFPVM